MEVKPVQKSRFKRFSVEDDDEIIEWWINEGFTNGYYLKNYTVEYKIITILMLIDDAD